MRYLLLGVLALITLSSCGDGDIITVELEFDGELERCDNNTEEFLMYDVIDDPDEALILIFPKTASNEALFTTEIPEEAPEILTINGNDTRFIYRTYSEAPTFCQVIDNGNSIITGDYEAASGSVEVSTSFEDDDNDGVPTAVEDANLDGDNDPSTDPTDTDDDGIPDYLDQDDDNDNVKTKDENPDPDGDGDVSDAQNTDSDDLPDYLDSDDDGDSIPTRLEDENENMNPSDDIDEESPNAPLARYLDFEAQEIYTDSGSIFNEYTRTYATKFVVDGVDLGIIRYERRTYGIFRTSILFSNED